MRFLPDWAPEQGKHLAHSARADMSEAGFVRVRSSGDVKDHISRVPDIKAYSSYFLRKAGGPDTRFGYGLEVCW